MPIDVNLELFPTPRPGAPLPGQRTPPRPRRRATLDHPLAAVGIAFGLLLPLHLWLSRHVPGPSLLWDGQGYLGTARWLARVDVPYLGDLVFYHAGYPALLAPLFRLLSSPAAVFRGALAVNAVAASAGFVGLVHLGRSAFGLTRRRALGLAGLASVYPAVLLQSGFEWAESVFVATFSGCVLLAWTFLRRRSAPAATALGVATAFLYAVHPRGVGMVVATAGLFGIVALGDRRRGPAAGVGLAALAAGMVVTGWVHAASRAALWAAGTGPASVGLAERLAEPAVWPEMALRAAGQLWYLAVVSLGLAVLGVVLLVSLAAGRWPQSDDLGPARRVLAVYLLGAMAAMALSSVVQITTHTRVDHLVYGRYNEGFLPLLLVAGGAWLLGPAGARARLTLGLATVTAITLLGAVVVAGNSPGAFSGDIAGVNVLGALMMDRTDPDHLDVVLVTVVALIAVIALAVVSVRRPAVAATLVGVAFLASAVDLQRRVTTPVADVANHTYVLAPQVDRFAAEGVPVSYDLAAHDLLAANRYQFQLLGRPFVFFDSAAGEEPPSGVVIASKSWGERRAAGRLVFAEPHHDQALWVIESPEPVTPAPV